MKTDQQRAEEALNMAVDGVDIRETRQLSAIANDINVPLHKRQAASRALRVLTNQYACVSIGSSASPLAERGGMTYRTDTPPTHLAVALFYEDGAPRRIEAHHPFTEARWNGASYTTADGGSLAGRLQFLGWLPLSEIRALAMARRAEYEALPGKTRRQKYVAAMTERAARANEVRRGGVKKLSSDFVIVDVKRGRKTLAKAIAAGKRFRAVIEVEIDTQHSRDDGTSIEFSGQPVRTEIEEIVDA